ncbi:hypothetical protein V495_04813 [Pseudogymnoascus sp. VKM F-4514 (FW-929)]|nr:hypothetical protein V495_04813 [Pseudogymnoascus sp. VKM F-4514 (FW-929)]KFY51604.1 hypothetical protein V497_08986 [Pseudogymnoascus sp. VKM F-4516 (FW-969)]
MEVNYADVFDSRDDNLYPSDPSLNTEDLQFIPCSPHSDPNFCFDTTVAFSTIPLPSFDPLSDPLDFSLDSSAFPTEIQFNNALKYSFSTGLPFGIQYPTPWAHFSMDEMISESHESIQDIKQAPTDENEPPNGTIHDSPKLNLNQHNHPYVCTHKSCTRKIFSNKSGLERHKREVHSPQQFKCPVPSCSRSKAGFHRRYNLDMHQRRVHGSQSQSSHSPPGLYNNSEDSEEGDETTLRPPHDRHVGSTAAMLQDDAVLKTQGGVDRKLQRLRLMRDELDEVMERASRIMREEY